ncbi:MAG: hypothetical protein ACJ8FL_02235 [Sphingomicrobium sp.]
MSTLEFYNQRAAQCRAEADATTLVNVRDRCLSAAAAWDEMADRVRRTQVYRVEDAARKVEQGRAGAGS